VKGFNLLGADHCQALAAASRSTYIKILDPTNHDNPQNYGFHTSSNTESKPGKDSIRATAAQHSSLGRLRRRRQLRLRRQVRYRGSPQHRPESQRPLSRSLEGQLQKTL